MSHFANFVCSCGAATLNGVSTSPEGNIKAYIANRCADRRTVYDSKLGAYKQLEGLYIKDAFVIYSGPTSKGKSSKYTKLATYIKKEKLGSVTKTPAKHNPQHRERKPGVLDLSIYIWCINHEGLKAWNERQMAATKEKKSESLLKG